MPIYEYHCTVCGETFELLLNLNEATRTVPCPHCRNNTAERIFSTFSQTASGSSSANCGSGLFT